MIGFEKIENQLINNFNAHKLHHGIIIAGKKGIGKASFTKKLCHNILNNNSSNLNTPPSVDLVIAEKLPDKKTIGIDTIRNVQQFLNYTSGISEYKFLIVDAVCELTNEASNALLKSLEEPKKNCFIILIAHQLSKILPTIKSRCQILKVPNFSKEQFYLALNQNHIAINKNDKEFLSQICENCPAFAIESGLDLIRFYQLLINSLINKKIENDILKILGDKNLSFAIVEKVLLYFLAQIIKKSNNLPQTYYNESELEILNFMTSKSYNKDYLELFNNVNQSLNKAVNSNLDKKINFINIFNQICYG